MVASTPKTRKAKGRAFQNWVAEQVLIKFPHLTERDVHGTTMGDTGADIKLSETAIKSFPYSVECKCVESINMWEAWKQAKANTEKDTYPVLFIKRNHTDPVVVISAAHFMELASKKDV